MKIWILIALLHLAPNLPSARAAVLTDAINSAVRTRAEAALLVAIAWHESGYTFEDRIGDNGHSVSTYQLWACPGVRCKRAKTDPYYAAREALRVAWGSIRDCRRKKQRPEHWLSQYTTGHCMKNREAKTRWRTAEELLRQVQAPVAFSVPEARMNKHIVVWDPNESFWTGALIEPEAVPSLTAKGVVMLPVDVDALMLSGAGGFAYRQWGAGWPLDYGTPRLVCPITIFARSTHRKIRWVARLVPDPRNLEQAQQGLSFSAGHIAFASGPARIQGGKAAITPSAPPYQISSFGKLDDQNGWNIRGDGILHPPGDSYFEFGLYGALPGVRVIALAASCTES